MDLPEINGYKILEKIGEGSYGNVYKAQHLPSGRAVAVKVVKPAGEGGKDRERRALEFYVRMRESSKKGIVQIFDSGRTTSGLLYYAMSLGECTLHDLANKKLKQKTWFSIPEIRKILSDIFDGLQSLENEGLVHRDIKPANIIFVDGKACLSDLGLLEIEDRDGARYGTEGFCASDYFKGNPDHWSVACVIFFLMTSRNPEKMSSPSAWVSPLGVQKMSRADIAEYERLRNVILNRATAFRAIENFRSAQEFRLAILEPEKPRRFKIFAAVFSAIAVLILLVCAVLFVRARGGNRQEIPAEPKISARGGSTQDNSAGKNLPVVQKKYELSDNLFEHIKEHGYFDADRGIKILPLKEWAAACHGVCENARRLLAAQKLFTVGCIDNAGLNPEENKDIVVLPQNKQTADFVEKICSKYSVADRWQTRQMEPSRRVRDESGEIQFIDGRTERFRDYFQCEAPYKEYAKMLFSGAGGGKSLFCEDIKKMKFAAMDFKTWQGNVNAAEKFLLEQRKMFLKGGIKAEDLPRIFDPSMENYGNYLKNVETANRKLAELEKPASEY